MGMPMELIFIRHAHPAWVVEDKSVLDPLLSELGIRQAKALAEHALSWSPVDALFVSPTRRTKETAGPLAEALGLTPKVLDWFEEIRLPSHWDGAPADQVGRVLRGSRKRRASDWWRGIENAEPYADFERRIVGGLTDLLASEGAHPIDRDDPGDWTIGRPRRLLFVGHGGSNAVAIGHLLGLASVPWPWERLVALHASISRVKATELRAGYIFGLRDHSNVGYLPKEMRSR